MDFSFWNYGRIENYYADMKAAVREWKDLGITLGFTFRCSTDPVARARLRELLDACATQNMRVIVYDDRVFVDTYKNLGREAYRRAVTEAEADFGGHPAVWGWYVGDEPTGSDLSLYTDAVSIVKACSAKQPFVNFFPLQNEPTGYARIGFQSEEQYLSAVAGFARNLPMLSYDRYSQCYQPDLESGWQRFGLDRYFRDLRVFSETAAEIGRPLWYSALSVGHWNYRTPTEEDVRWQIATAFAFNVQLLQWFFLYQHRWADDYFGYPVQMSGHKTPLYYAIAHETESFKQRVERPLAGFTHQAVWHINDTFGGCERLTAADEPDVHIFAYHHLHGLLARFVDGKGQKKYLLVNAEQRSAEVFGLYIRGKLLRNIWLPAGGTHVFSPQEAIQEHV